MKIEKLDIKGFGKFQNQVFILNKGMNVIYGSNEAGKSTLQAFIKGMLFGLKGGRRAKDGTLPDIRQFRPWSGHLYGGILEYTLDDGGRYTVGRNFQKSTVNLQDAYSNDITNEFAAGKEEGIKFAEQHLGLSEKSFVRTAFIGQMQSFVDPEGKKVLAERLLNLRQTGDEEVSFRKAMQALKDAQLSYVGSERTTTRPLNLVETRLVDALKKEQELIELHESRMDIYASIVQLKKESTRLQAQREELIKAKKILLENRQIADQKRLAFKLGEYRDQLVRTRNDSQKTEEEIAVLQAKLEHLNGYNDFTRSDANELSSNYTRYQILEKELEELQRLKTENKEKLEQAEKILKQYKLFETEKERIAKVLEETLYQKSGVQDVIPKRTRPGTQKVLPAAILFLAVAILTEIFLIRNYLPDWVNILILILCATLMTIFSIILYIAAVRQKQSQKETYIQYQSKRANNQSLLNEWMRDVKVENLQDFIGLKAMYENNCHACVKLRSEHDILQQRETKLLTQIEGLKTKVSPLLNRVNLGFSSGRIAKEDIQAWTNNLEACFSYISDIREMEGMKSRFNQREQGILREASLLYGADITTAEQLEEVIHEMERTLKQPQQSKYDITPEQVADSIEECNEALLRNQLKMNTLSTRLENIPDTEALQQAHEIVHSLLEEKERIVFLNKALETAMQVLSEAGLAIQRDYVPLLNREMSSILRLITGEKYEDLKADDQLTLKLQPAELTETVIPEQLSSGTSDQVYLALRLGAVRLVERQGEKLPLFLDEPFAQYDEARTRNAIELLAKESQTRQIMLFTCKKREVELIQEIWGAFPLHIINLDAEES